MNIPPVWLPELHNLLDLLYEDQLSESSRQRLNELLAGGKEQRNYYITYMDVHSYLAWNGVQPALSPPTTCSHPSPVLGFLSTTYHGTIGLFSQELPFSLLIATLLTGFGLWIASLVYVSSPEEIAQNIPASPTNSSVDPTLEVVGKITGMIDCKWADPNTETFHGANVLLGRKYALSSGHMEITYNTGAKVILQGPVTYEVKTKNGGFLSTGRLTGRVEVETAKGFAVRTPTAIITDLGTEFGVEVDRQGSTTSRVFRGAVRVQAVSGADTAEGAGQVLRENESACVEIIKDTADGSPRLIVTPLAAAPTNFVREIPKLSRKTFDLVDVVAGGDGFSGRRNRGIDPTNGRAVASNTLPDLTGDGKYHCVEAIPFVDGVFIPHGGVASVQLDSAGHTFAEFGNANNLAASHVWAGGEIPTVPRNIISAKIGGIDYGSPDHGFLYLHANKGITFSLDAIRRANPGWKIVRFCAVAGNTENISATGQPVHAELWVFVDGQLQFRRRDVSSYSGAMPINIPIVDKQAFLTLVATDGGHQIGYNWTIFGDPRLDLIQISSGAKGP